MNIETIQKNLQKLFNDKIECVIVKGDNRVENLRWVTPFENMFENNITFEHIKNKGDRFLLETLKTTLKREK